MSHLSIQKAAKFAGLLAVRLQDAELVTRQSEYEQRTAANNAELTALLAVHKEAGTVPTGEELQRFPPPCESPMESLSREIYGEMAVNG